MSPFSRTVLAIVMIIGTTAGVVAAGAFIYISRRAEIVVDEHLCPINAVTKGHIVVLVDWTDPFTPQQRDALKDLFNRIKRDIAVHERLSLHLITGDAEKAGSPLFSFCKPLDPDNINPLIENERRLRDRWHEKFGKPLDAALSELMKGSIAPVSPILEAFDVILWSHSFQGDLPRRQLIVFSDLLQNMPDHSHYKHVPDPCTIVATPLGRRIKAKDWTNLRVVLHYWRNPQAQHIQGPEHLAFWVQILYLFGAAEVWHGNRVTLKNESLGCFPSVEPKGKRQAR